MQLTIDLDMNKIDYDSINKQILEKLSAMNLKEEYDIESKIDKKITGYINDKIDYSYNAYIDNYWNDTTSEGMKLIEKMSKEEIKNRTAKVIDDVFNKEFDEKTLKEIMIKMLPDVFATLLFRKIDSSLFSKECNYYDEMYNMVRSQINNAFNSRLGC